MSEEAGLRDGASGSCFEVRRFGRYLAQRRILTERHAELTGALIASGGPETQLAQRAGVTRVTVRKALGKR